MEKLKPAQKDNRRYLLICGDNEKVEKALLNYLGVLGFARAGYMLVKKKKKKIISSVKRKEIEKVKAALCMEGLKIERVSGTLRGVEQ
jgi:RNase P/RNase MRP subunit POP5